MSNSCKLCMSLVQQIPANISRYVETAQIVQGSRAYQLGSRANSTDLEQTDMQKVAWSALFNLAYQAAQGKGPLARGLHR